jgi:DNA-directed RNA polymerase subunit omega
MSGGTRSHEIRGKTMIEELKSTELIKKVGGRFKLTALIQRRLTELMQGSRPLIEDAEGKTHLEIAIQEILQDKIAVDHKASGIAEPGRE